MRHGKIDIVIGTHAIIQDGVVWHRLGMVVIDEQHRFGVNQRGRLRQTSTEGIVPHLLTMTATPIPRSLALTLFGDLEVSTIDELPKNRQPILTRIFQGDARHRLYKLIHREVSAGRQAYIVYPLVQNSEAEGMERLKATTSEYERLKMGPLQGLRLGMLHGQMESTAQAQVMSEFQAGKIDVLIATTVIEVGVDVPNANVMAVGKRGTFWPGSAPSIAR